jgi:glucose/arabinose dehydrogenase
MNGQQKIHGTRRVAIGLATSLFANTGKRSAREQARQRAATKGTPTKIRSPERFRGGAVQSGGPT